MNTYINKVFILLLMSFFTTALHAQYNPENPAEPGAPIVYYKLSLRATPSGAGTFNISTSTTQAVGANVSLRANSSNSEYVFVAWTENDVVVSTASQFTYTMPAHHVELVAHFDYRPASPGEPSVPNIPVYSTVYLSCSPANSGSFNISSGNRYVVGTSVSITATNKTDFTFSHWTENDSTISTSKTLQYVVKESDAHLVAHFQYSPSSPAEPPVLQPTHRLTLQVTPSGSGSASGGGEYQPGTAITLKATAKTDYAFDAWLENGTVLSTASSYTYTMPDRDVILTARFKVSYNPSNPSEPVFPTNERHNIFGMTENALQGQRILYPVYLENTTPLMNMYIDLTFPDGFVVDTANCSLSDRCNGNWLEKILVEGNMWRMRVRGTNTFIGANGNIMLIPVTVPDTAQMGKNYLVALSHGVIMRPDSTQIPVGVRSGYIYVTKTLEEGLYAQYTYEKLNGRVFFKNQSSDSAQTYIWEFGDGTFSTEFSPLHLYDNAGMYSVLLNSKGHVDTDIAEQTVIINDRDKWKLGGAFHLADSITSVRHFLSTQSLLDFLSDVAIAETNVTIFGQANAEHGMQLTDANIATLTKVHSLLSGSQYTISFTNDGLGTTAYAMGDANDTLTTDRISLFNNLGDITLCHNAITKLCGIEYNPWIIRQIPNQYVYVDNATSEIDLSVIGPNLQYSWQLVDTTWLTSGFIAGCVQAGTGNIPSMRIINKTGRLVDLTYQVQVRYGEWLFREFTKTFTIEPSPYEYLTPEYITLCYGDTCLWRDSAYVESGVYADTIGNEISTLHLTIRPEVPVTNDSVTICHGATYVWNGSSYSAGGEYSMTLQDINGCDSVAVLHLTVLPVPTTEETAIACDSLSWNGQTYTQSGDYVYTTTAANGCDSIVTLHLTIHYSDTAYFTATACDSYEWHGVVYTQSGVYPYLTQTVHGCDSLELLDLTIHYSDTAYFTATACDSYEWHGVVYTQSGVYEYLTQTVHGCDSLELLDLTIHYSDTAYFTATACDSYEWHGVVYTQSGVYPYLTQTVHGCDSLELLTLTIHYSDTAYFTATACDSYEWHGIVYTQSGVYPYLTQTVHGCDSLELLTLTIHYSDTAYFTATACDSYEWHGVVYTQSGVYPYLTQTVHGCDSLELLDLTIHYSEVGVTEYATICYGDTYTWNGQTYSTTGEYTLILSNTLGCDSVATLHLTILPEAVTTTQTVVVGSNELPYQWRGKDYSATGLYTDIEKYSIADCDSAIHILNLTVLTTGNYDEQSATICDTEAPYLWYGQSYSVTGKYTYTEQYVGTDIDSIQHILNLTVNPTLYTEYTATVCDTYTWNNETYNTSGDYTQTFVAITGCDSIVTLHLTIHYSDTAYFTATACDSYEWHGVVYTQSGVYPYLTQTVHGCDSLELLDLTIHYSDTAYFTATACDSYEWHGVVYTQSGVYSYLTQTVHGCDSLELLDLTIHYSDTAYFTATACDSYEWHGVVYTQSGVYPYRTQTVHGCDSLELLDLTIHYSDTAYFTATACDSYEWHGIVYTQSGVYPYLTQTVHGCDSLELLNLTIHYSDTSYFTATACDSYEWHGVVYTQSGVYSYLTQTVHGCDSLELLTLTIHYSDTAYFTATACDSYEWHGVVYTQSGVYPYLTQTVHGCDSLELLNLTIHYSDTAYFTATACDSYEWHGVVYTQSGVYEHLTQTVHGCDSLELLDLTIHYSDTAYFTTTACDSYEWHGVVYTQSGVYPYLTQTVHGCDSLELLDLTIHYSDTAYFTATACDSYEWHGVVYTQSGVYEYLTQTVHGCDSLELLDLTIHYSDTAYFTTTACDSYEWHGVVYTQSGVYPYLTQTVHGCDSLELLDLTIHYSDTAYFTATACDSYEWHDIVYTQSGVYEYLTQTVHGCDSLELLNLTIHYSDTAYFTATACDSYEWHGQVYTQSGVYPYLTQTVHGCDSLELLDLTIHYSDTAYFTATACDSYEWHGVVYTQSGVYPYLTQTVHGCDSLELLNLTIHYSEVGATEYATICYGDTYTWNGQTYSTTGEYSITLSNTLGCDSVAILELTILPEAVITEESATINEEYLPYIWRGQSYYATGTYTITEPFANYTYCDSAVHLLHLTVEAPNKSGDNLYWHYKNDTLTFTGSGAMYDNPDMLSYRNESWYPARVNHVILSTELTHIGNVAFADCSNLTQIVIPNSVNSIGDGAFSWTGLQSITIPASVTELGEQVFEACSNLHTIIYEGYPTVISNQTIHPLIGCVHLDTVIAPAALWHCTNADKALEKRYGVPHKARYIEVTDGDLTNQAVKYIAQNATALEVLDLTNTTNTTLPYGAFSHSYLLTQLYLPAYIETLPESMIEGGNRLMEITIPATVTEIGNYAFAGCVNIWRMTVEATTPPKVYENTFDGISRSISVLVPAGSEQAYREAEYWREFFIDNTNSPLPISNCQKILREDHILILRDGRTYTIMGQEL